MARKVSKRAADLRVGDRIRCFPDDEDEKWRRSVWEVVEVSPPVEDTTISYPPSTHRVVIRLEDTGADTAWYLEPHTPVTLA